MFAAILRHFPNVADEAFGTRKRIDTFNRYHLNHIVDTDEAWLQSGLSVLTDTSAWKLVTQIHSDQVKGKSALSATGSHGKRKYYRCIIG